MQKLGDLTFTFNPDLQDIPQKRKTVSAVGTYTDSAVFQWPALWPGAIINLGWDWMPDAQYDALYALYLSDAKIVYDPDTGGDKYSVIVMDMTGKYFEVVQADSTYRKDVKMTLQVRSYTYDPPTPPP